MADNNTASASSQLVRHIMDDVKNKKLNINSVMTLVVKAMELVEKVPGLDGRGKKECVIAALNELAKGADGIAGTEDDLIPGYVMEGLKFMLLNQVVENIIDVVVAATKGVVNVNAAAAVVTTAAPICCGIFAKCLGQ
jgi:hypothetical protein